MGFEPDFEYDSFLPTRFKSVKQLGAMTPHFARMMIPGFPFTRQKEAI